MPRWRVAAVAAAGLVAAVASTVLAVAVNAATSGTADWYRGVKRHPPWWTAGATAAVACAGLLLWAAQEWHDRALKELIPARERPERWMVDRPAEVDRIVRALRHQRGGTVGITTAVHGVGGYGKTTVAKMVRAHRRVLRRFKGRVYWVTLGRDAGKQTLTGLINDLITRIHPGSPVTFVNAQQAGDHLAAVLAKGPRRLVILDDVWSEEQLAVFPVSGRCARLITTRNPSLATAVGVPVQVDQMSAPQARALLGSGLPALPSAVTEGLVKETGRCPLLLHLVNKFLADEARLHTNISPVAEDLLGRIRQAGVLQVDQLTRQAAQCLDVNVPEQRRHAVCATIEASTGLLAAHERSRLAELGVFAEDETIPVSLVGTLWHATGGLDQRSTDALCARLADLALVSLVRTDDGGAIEIHDVIRDYLHSELGGTRLRQLHQILLHATEQALPVAAGSIAGADAVTAWWELPATARYLQEHLIGHLLAAGRPSQAGELAGDLRWVEARLHASGPAGPYRDLALIGTPHAERLRQIFGQAAHLLAPTEPPHSLTDILYSPATIPIGGARLRHSPPAANCQR